MCTTLWTVHAMVSAAMERRFSAADDLCFEKCVAPRGPRANQLDISSTVVNGTILLDVIKIKRLYNASTLTLVSGLG